MNNEGKREHGLPEAIGLCFSGGGYRAAGYSLGTLDYLDHLGLREKVTMLSTVSGGSFAGAAYAISLVEETPFSQFFAESYRFFKDAKYVEELLKYLSEPLKNGKRRNLIQAAAEVYANSFLKNEKTGESYLFGDIIEAEHIHMQSVIFNTTCFYSGLNFPFHTGGNPYTWVGNLHTTLSGEDAKQIRLADIVATSSCFPGGFEPMAFPDGFVWPKAVPKVERTVKRDGQLKTGNLIDPMPLMDGGVADNSGLMGLIQTHKDMNKGRKLRRKKPVELDQIIASDVDHNPIDLYKRFPLKHGPHSFFQKESRTRLTLASLDYLIITAAIVLFLIMLGLGINGWQHMRWAGFKVSNLLTYLTAFLFSGMSAGGLLLIRRLLRNTVPDWFDQKMQGGAPSSWNVLKRLTLGQAINMIKLRVSSLIAMTSDVFMASIRKKTYAFIQKDPTYGKKLIYDQIYIFNEYTESMWRRLVKLPPPSRRLINVIDAVADMNSTLWWEKDYQLPCLIACAQVNLCLQWFMQRKFIDEKGDDDLLFNRLRNDWEKLNENPYALIEERYQDQLKDMFPLPLPPEKVADSKNT